MPNTMPILESAPLLHSFAGYIKYSYRLKGSCDTWGGVASGVVSAWTALWDQQSSLWY